MKIGVMIGPEWGDTARKVRRLLEEIAWAESAGLPSAWVPQVPSDLDALQMVSLLGMNTERIELGTAVVPLQLQHPVALARQALTAKVIAGLRAAGAGDIPVIVGGTIPAGDVPRLMEAGARAVFPTGTPLDAVVAQVRAITEAEQEH